MGTRPTPTTMLQVQHVGSYADDMCVTGVMWALRGPSQHEGLYTTKENQLRELRPPPQGVEPEGLSHIQDGARGGRKNPYYPVEGDREDPGEPYPTKRGASSPG